MDSPLSSKHVCVGCGGEITDQYVLRVAPDLEWHASCLKCSDCQLSLDENCTCFVREGKTYCKEDYIRLFGTKCAKCGSRFAKNDLVMRAKNNIYHLDCFSCVSCGRQLIPGDEFALREDGLLCRADHEALERGNFDFIGGGGGGGEGGSTGDGGGNPQHEDSRTETNNNEDSKIVSTDSTSSHGSSSPIIHRTNSRNNPSSGPAAHGGHYHHNHGHGHGGHHGGHHGHGGHGRVGGRGHHQKGEQKTTRIRTVLNEKQLHTLRTCYSANSRPDALMKEQLVEMTGLSPRVIRVWFQNKRCKDKKRSIVLKQLQQQQQNKNDKCILDESSWLSQKGIPLIATSPVRHEPPNSLQTSPVEVEKYAAPWSDLTDLQSLQLEMEKQSNTTNTTTTPFQQLMNSFGDSFDDDTVVSFDELSDGNGGRLIPPHHHQQQQQHQRLQQQQQVMPPGLHPPSAYVINGHY